MPKEMSKNTGVGFKCCRVGAGIQSWRIPWEQSVTTPQLGGGEERLLFQRITGLKGMTLDRLTEPWIGREHSWSLSPGWMPLLWDPKIPVLLSHKCITLN